MKLKFHYILHCNSSWSSSHNPLQSVPGQVNSRAWNFSQGASSKLLLWSHLHLEMSEGGSGEGCRAGGAPMSGFLSSWHLGTLSSFSGNIITSNSWNTHRPPCNAREKVHLLLRSCRAAVRWKAEVIVHHCEGFVLQPLLGQGFINPVHIKVQKIPSSLGSA